MSSEQMHDVQFLKVCKHTISRLEHGEQSTGLFNKDATRTVQHEVYS